MIGWETQRWETPQWPVDDLGTRWTGPGERWPVGCFVEDETCALMMVTSM